ALAIPPAYTAVWICAHAAAKPPRTDSRRPPQTHPARPIP
ncbi:hypothetical protein, partial [Stenotrophomonas maltophilia]